MATTDTSLPEPPASAKPTRPRLPHHLLAYAVSLPERLLRFIAMCLGLILKSLMWLLPKPIREGKFYKLAVERQIKMLTDDVGQAQMFKGQEAVTGEQATRMAIGGAVDNLMMIGLHASPMWILFAASDISKGAQAYVKEIGKELKDAGVMAEGSRVDSVEDLIGGIARLSDRLADTVDMPPLSVDAMKETVNGIRDEMHAGGRAMLDTADLDGLANNIRELAEDADHSLLETTGAVATGSLRGAGNIIKGGLIGAGATVKFAGRIIWDDVLGDYGRSIQKMYRRGFYGAVRGFVRPQSRSLHRLFAYPFLTFTEIALSLGRWRKAAWKL